MSSDFQKPSPKSWERVFESRRTLCSPQSHDEAPCEAFLEVENVGNDSPKSWERVFESRRTLCSPQRKNYLAQNSHSLNCSMFGVRLEKDWKKVTNDDFQWIGLR